jgi:hypothetical protein
MMHFCSGVRGNPSGEEDDERIWIEYYVFFISKIFMCNLGIYYAKIYYKPPFSSKKESV